MPKNFDEMENSNTSCNPSIHEVSSARRRLVLKGSVASVAATIAPFGALSGCASVPGVSVPGVLPALGFKAVPPDQGDRLVVPEGYTAKPIAAWGEPVGIAGNMPAFRWTHRTVPMSNRFRWECITTVCTSMRWTTDPIVGCWR